MKSASKIGSRTSFAAALDHAIAHARDAQRALPSVGLGDGHPPRRARPVAPRLQGRLDRVRKAVTAPRGRCDIFYAHTVHARRSAVNADLVPGGRQNVAPVSPVAQRVKPILPAPASP